MTKFTTRAGFTLVELLLFLGLASIMFVTLTSVYIATQESRLRQQGIAGVEQRGTQISEQIAKNIRRAEAVLDPAVSETGSILALQMGLNTEFPTIFGLTQSGQMILIQKTTTSSLLSTTIIASDLEFRNVEDKSVLFTFTLTANIPSVPPSTYSKTFGATAALYADDQSDAGGCGSCSVPACVGGEYIWDHCVSDACVEASFELVCD